MNSYTNNMNPTVLVNLISLITFAVELKSYVVKTIPEDQEYAEDILLTGRKSTDPKKCLRKDLRNKTNVCDIKQEEFFEICKEVVHCENIRCLFTSFILDNDQLAKPCKNYSVKFHRKGIPEDVSWTIETPEEIVRTVSARECPTIIGGHRLWVSQGPEEGGVFVFSSSDLPDDELRTEDYIVFLDTGVETEDDTPP